MIVRGVIGFGLGGDVEYRQPSRRRWTARRQVVLVSAGQDQDDGPVEGVMDRIALRSPTRSPVGRGVRFVPCRDLMGSSMMMRSAAWPVMSAPIPTERTPPIAVRGCIQSFTEEVLQRIEL